jgi:prophage tail gpP-like protein
MASITTRAGDTFDLLARRVYGDDRQATRLRTANPGATEPFAAGVVLTAPQDPAPPARSEADNDSELALLIDGQRFRFWSAISVTRSIDSMDTVDLSAPFDPEDAQVRATFQPLSFKPVNVNVGGTPLFSGTIVTVDPQLQEGGRTVAAAGYSVPAVMGDCTAPASAYPLEWDNSSLKVIAEAVAAPFSVSVKFEGLEGAPFERVSLKPGEAVLPFLIKLAQQRSLLVSSTPEGALLFIKPTTPGRPVARLTEGASPILEVVPTFDPQKYFSEVTGIAPTAIGQDGRQATTPNPQLRGVVRPHTFEADDNVPAELDATVSAKAGRMFANVVTYSCTVATWRDPAGDLWAPNTTVTVDAPGAMIYGEFEFLVRAVTLTRTAEGGESATLVLTFPGAFSGELPGGLPWEG